jgi:tetratricopeptide (TPR) repeat protein
MALGFGFNKAKVLSAAEKYVQQGKLQAAIAEYDKIIKQDPKDLTVLNTMGDLFARVGNNSQAVSCFKQVGDAYATAGFLVKAIAMYKKLTKLSPHDIDSVGKLADLYSQQGLYSDARSQYMVVADQFMKTGQNDSAAGIFKKMLELDPENANMQTRLADLYLKLGKKDDAKGIFLKAAQSLHMRGSLDAADEALDRVLKIDPKSAEALILRAQIATESNKPEKATACLEKIPDIDSRPDVLKSLLNGFLQTGHLDGAEPVLATLLNTHKDSSGIKPYADALLSKGRAEDAIKIYSRYADVLLASESEGLISSLQSAVGKVKENPSALELVLKLLRKAGATTYINEVLELLAHAYVQAGKLQRATAIYKELSELEPDNSSHATSMKQLEARMGTDPATRELTEEESEQAFMVEELQHSSPVLKVNYPKEIADAVRAALTDSELFSSYNLPEKAIAPLEAALPIAPQDPQLHQQLAMLYVRSGRFQDAANSCKILSKLYAEAGHQEQANQYAAMGAKYEDQAGEQPAMAPPLPRLSTPGISVEVKADRSLEPAFSASSMAEFAFEQAIESEAPAEISPAKMAFQVAPEPPEVREVEIPRSISSSQIREYTGPVMEAPTPALPAATPMIPPPAQEVDLSGEWEEMLVVEEHAAAPEAPPQGPATLPAEPVAELQVQTPAGPADLPATPSEPEVAPVAEDPAAAARREAQEAIEELRFYLDQKMVPEAQTALARLVSLAPEDPAITELRAEFYALRQKKADEAATTKQAEAAAAAAAKAAEEAAKAKPAKPVAKPVQPVPSEFSFDLDLEEHAPVDGQAAQARKQTSVDDLEILDLGQEKPAAPLPTKPHVAEPARAAASAKHTATPLSAKAHAAASQISTAAPAANPLGDLVLDLEEALGTDFGQPAQAAAHTPTQLAMTAHQAEILSTSQKTQKDDETTSVLSDLFEEFKGEVEVESDGTEDPETHYNLGVAFKEMGLLDEAIGELQKVCHAINKGKEFSQVIQAYTWLAHCLMEKGAPQAAVRWYESALKLPGIAEESRLAVYYDLASAHEASGDRKAALDDLMKVYGSNIDYRDVAERIKTLRA